MPNYIEKMDITNASIAYGEGLDIEDVKAVDEDGIVVIYVTLNGKQEYLNSGVTTNGTNIVINANIKVDVFAPATEQEVKAKVENSEATNYENDGVATATVLYSAPSGVLTVEAISGYDDENSMITSVHQGTIEDEIEIFDEVKTAKMDIIVMNNNNNTVSEVSILGRIPFKGVKDLATGEDLGTTSDTTLAGALVQSSSNKEQFNIYYSVNPDATKTLDDPENEWKKDVEDYSKIKSFLIVPVDKDYTMQKAEVVKFSYEYIIPENLQHNESFYGTFMAYYVNNTEVAKIDEESQADKVGLTTGEGPEISLEFSSNKEQVKEYEEIKYTAVVKNVGTSKSDETKVTIPVPRYTEYVSSSSDNDKVRINVDGNNAIYNIGTLEAGEKVELVLIVKALALPIVDEETGNQVGTALDVKNKAVATANDLQKDLFSEEKVVQVKKAELTVTLNTPIDQMGLETAGTDEEEEFVYYRSNPYLFYGQVENLDNKPISNLKATVKVPEGFNVDKAYRIAYDTDGITIIEVNDGVNYDESSRVVTYNFSEIEASRAGNFVLQVSVGDLPDGKTKVNDTMVIEAKADNTDKYTSNEANITIGVPALEITQTTNTKNTYVKEGQTIEYVFNVKNVGCATATGVKLTDRIPEGLKVQSAVYTIAGNKSQTTSLNGKEVIINASIRPGEELNATVKAMAANLNGIQEKSVTNEGEVKADHITSSTTNAITHIVEADEQNSVLEEEDTSGATGTSRLEGSLAAKKSTEKRSESNVVKTYRITGNVWLDANRNGMRDNGEQAMRSDVSLVNIDTGSIVKKGSTTSSGDYTFTGVENGKYTVIFDYDTTMYTATLFKQDGVAQDVNSDAVTTQIEQDGRIRNAAITDTIEVNDLSISNIDLGLVNAQKFDLSVDKVITKITSQSNNATNTLNFENGSKLTQMPIAGKYVASTVVYIEYVITVKNEGDIAGYARKVVDYLPSGMQLNSSLSPDWYSGNDGNLYSSSLADVELQPGEARQLKLVLTRQMTVDNTDIVSNQAEIAEDYNIYGVSDINSTPMNKVQKENDLSKADAILTIRTGETLIYTSVIITSIILGAIIIAIAYAKIVIPKRKRGV